MQVHTQDFPDSPSLAMSIPKLNQQALSSPTPSRPVRILQFGEGNFLRAFADWMIHQMNAQADFNSDVVVVQPIPQGRVAPLMEQDGLYHVLLQGIKDGKAEETPYLIDVIQRGINPYEQYEDYLAEADNPDLSIILSNTTEAGIKYQAGESLQDNPQVSFPGKLTALLYRRFQTFGGSPESGLLFLPCELIDKNGEKLKDIILTIAQEWGLEKGFGDWIKQHCIFCNTLVDRIVPGYPADSIEHIQASLGYEDHSVVVGEQFHLLVIEGPASIKEIFPAEKAGLNVIVTEDQLARYRTRKVRILNGAHTLNVPIGILYGVETVREAIDDPVVGSFLRAAIFEEIIPTLDLPKEELHSFANEVIDRFRNPYVRHLLSSIALNSVSKFKTRDLPSLLQYQQSKGELPSRLCLGLAALIVFYEGKFDGKQMPIKDGEAVKSYFSDQWTAFRSGAQSLTQMIQNILAKTDFWEQDLNEVPGLTDRISQDVQEILAGGLKNKLERFG